MNVKKFNCLNHKMYNYRKIAMFQDKYILLWQQERIFNVNPAVLMTHYVKSCQKFHFENVPALTAVLLRHTETIIPQFKEILFL